jgi:hypothetical protein
MSAPLKPLTPLKPIKKIPSPSKEKEKEESKTFSPSITIPKSYPQGKTSRTSSPEREIVSLSIKPSSIDKDKIRIPAKKSETETVSSCFICKEGVDDTYRLHCHHYLCTDCLFDLSANQCPVCFKPLSGKHVTSEIIVAVTQKESQKKAEATMHFYIKSGMDTSKMKKEELVKAYPSFFY